MENRTCPECGNSMHKKDQNWVTIDKCSSCEWVFLDFWEKKDIIKI